MRWAGAAYVNEADCVVRDVLTLQVTLEARMNFAVYMIGVILVVGALAYGASLVGLSPTWIAMKMSASLQGPSLVLGQVWDLAMYFA